LPRFFDRRTAGDLGEIGVAFLFRPIRSRGNLKRRLQQPWSVDALRSRSPRSFCFLSMNQYFMFAFSARTAKVACPGRIRCGSVRLRATPTARVVAPVHNTCDRRSGARVVSFCLPQRFPNPGPQHVGTPMFVSRRHAVCSMAKTGKSNRNAKCVFLNLLSRWIPPDFSNRFQKRSQTGFDGKSNLIRQPQKTA